ncbi:MAG: thioredoxin fold domain-containing protein [Thermofilaceae archaeon]
MRKLFIGLFAVSLSWASVCDRDFRQDLPFAPSDVKVLSKREVAKGLCEVLLQDKEVIVPLYIGEDFTMVGALFRQGQDLTAKARQEARAKVLREKIDSLKSFVVASTGIPKDDRYFFYFVDPNCRYCEASKRRTVELAKAKGYEVYLVFLPFLGPDSRSKVSRFVCSKGTIRDYLEGNYSGSECPQGNAYVEKVLEMASSLGIGGVPFYLFPDGYTIEGANFAELEKRLSQ